MRTRRWFSPWARAVVVVVASLMLLAAPVGAAGPPVTGSGSGAFTSLEITSERNAGGNSIQDRTLTGVVFSGPLSGSIVQNVTGTVHRNGQVTFRGTMVFTGTIDGCGSGTVTLGVSGRGLAGANPVTVSQVRVINQASNTVAVTGQGTVYQDGPNLSYQITYTCR
jgi:hypothetical protein